MRLVGRYPLVGHGDSRLYTFLPLARRAAVRRPVPLPRARRGNLPQHGPVIVIMNHKANLDPVIVGMICDRPLRYMAKKELFVNCACRELIATPGRLPDRPRSGRPGGARDLAGDARPRATCCSCSPKGIGSGTTRSTSSSPASA